MANTRFNGITIWGWLLVLGSLYQMALLASSGWGHYAYLFQQYSPQVILIRYWTSWIIKIAGLIAGIGILKRNETCRKLAILSSLFVVLFVGLKHPYAAYALHAKHLDQTLGSLFPISFSSLVGTSLFIQRAIDVIFGSLLIYFFTRPKIKEQFKS